MPCVARYASSDLLMRMEPALVTRAAAGARGARGDGRADDEQSPRLPQPTYSISTTSTCASTCMSAIMASVHVLNDVGGVSGEGVDVCAITLAPEHLRRHHTSRALSQ